MDENAKRFFLYTLQQPLTTGTKSANRGLVKPGNHLVKSLMGVGGIFSKPAFSGLDF